MQCAALAALAGLAMAVCTVRAQTTNDYIVDQFGTDTSANWTVPWDIATIITWDPTENSTASPGNPPGALKLTIPFSYAVYGVNNSATWQVDLGATVDFRNYTKIHFDAMVDPSSSRLSDGSDAFGPLQLSATDYSWNNANSSDVFIVPGGQPYIGSDYGNWDHYTATINQSLGISISDMNIMFFNAWSGGSAGHTNTVILWLDNVWLEYNTNNVVPPPTLAMQPTSGGLKLVASGTDQWNRQGIRTISGGESWVGKTGPVTYTMTITQPSQLSGFVANIFLIPNTSGVNDADWTDPSAVVLSILDNGNGSAAATFGFKTNLPSNGSLINIATLNSAKIDGTWNLTFNQNTNVTVTAPDGSSTNFVMSPVAVSYFASPLDAFFGVEATSVPNIGGKISVGNVTVSGTAVPINDSFTGSSLNAGIWTLAAGDAPGVVVAPANSKYWCTWSLPATGFSPQISTNLAVSSWTSLNSTGIITAGLNENLLLLTASNLPAGKNAFIRLIQRKFTMLQVLMPGETNAPGTVSGKIGTPIAQAVGVPFDVTVNAVDANWNVLTTPTDMVDVTSSDGTAYVTPSAPLVSGTRIFSVTPGTSGTFTITATDVTDTTKTANTGSPTMAN